MQTMRDSQGEMLRNAHLVGFLRRICRCSPRCSTEHLVNITWLQVFMTEVIQWLSARMTQLLDLQATFPPCPACVRL